LTKFGINCLPALGEVCYRCNPAGKGPYWAGTRGTHIGVRASGTGLTGGKMWGPR